MSRRKPNDYALVVLILVTVSIPVLMLIGRVQVCRSYFQEITLPACLVTTLPALPRKCP